MLDVSWVYNHHNARECDYGGLLLWLAQPFALNQVLYKHDNDRGRVVDTVQNGQWQSELHWCSCQIVHHEYNISDCCDIEISLRPKHQRVPFVPTYKISSNASGISFHQISFPWMHTFLVWIDKRRNPASRWYQNQQVWQFGMLRMKRYLLTTLLFRIHLLIYILDFNTNFTIILYYSILILY